MTDEEEKISTAVFAVRTTAGQEKNVADRIAARVETNKLPIKAILVPETLKGYVFIEADGPHFVDEAIAGIKHVRSRVPGIVSFSEVERYIVVRPVIEELHPTHHGPRRLREACGKGEKGGNDVSEKKVVKALIGGGQATAGPPLAPALGPLGVNVLAIVNKINEVTKQYAGMKVPVQITVDIETKEFEVSVGTPTTSALIVSELRVEKGSGAPKTEKIGNLSMQQIVKIAKVKHSELLARNLKFAVKEILGSCVSMGVTVEEKDPREVQKEIDEGKHDTLLTKEM
jgi:large subunit ribosomal protein L11